MKFSRTYLLLLAATSLWCGLILLAPIMARVNGGSFLANGLYSFFGKVCHQIDARSLHIDGEKLAVCARCSGIYFSFLFMLILYPFLPNRRIRNSRLFLLVAIFPMLLDVGLDMTGIHTSTIVTRLFTGAMFGFPVCYLLIPDLEKGLGFLSMKIKTKLHFTYASETR